MNFCKSECNGLKFLNAYVIITSMLGNGRNFDKATYTERQMPRGFR